MSISWRARDSASALGAQFQRVLQAGLRGRGVQLGQVGLELFEFDIGALALIGGQLAVALQVGDADLDAALGEFRLLRGALQFAQPGASGLGLGGQGLAFDLGVGETRLMLGQFFVQRFEAGLGFLARGAQVFLVGRDFLQVLAQARGALAGLLGLLLQARMLELDVVHAARDFGHALARRRDRWGHLLPGDLGAGHGGAGLVGDQLLRDFALQVLDLLLAGQQAGLFGVGRVKRTLCASTRWPALTTQAAPAGSVARMVSAWARSGAV